MGQPRHQRRHDVLRGVLGLRGDLAGVSPDGVLASWNWDFAGSFNRSDQISRVTGWTMSPSVLRWPSV